MITEEELVDAIDVKCVGQLLMSLMVTELVIKTGLEVRDAKYS